MKNLFIADNSSISQKSDFEEADYRVLEYSRENSLDEWIDKFVCEIHDDYTNIFLPLCFGATLTDFLGLRLALHIRCTKGKFQACNIFIYGSESLKQIIKNEFFDVLKLPGIFLIDYSLEEIKKYMQLEEKQVGGSSIQNDLDLLNLKVPLHLFDNHSVANIWGMHRLLDLGGADSKTVQSLSSIRNSLSNIFFKWLLAKNDIESLRNQVVKDAEEIFKSYKYKIEGPKVVGKIDLPESKKKRPE